MLIAFGLGQLIPPGEILPFSYIGHARNTDIYLFDLNRDLLVNLTSSPEMEMTPSISADYRRIAYIYGGSGSLEIRAMERPFVESVFLTTTTLASAGLAWSPDGQKLARISQDSRGSYSLQLMQVATGMNRTLLESRDILLSPSWSPDGTQLAYSRGVPENPGDLYVVDTDCQQNCYQQSTLFSAYPTAVHLPVWSPDGTQMVFFIYQGTGRVIATLPVSCLQSPDGCVNDNPRWLDVPDILVESSVQWSKDGSRLFFQGIDLHDLGWGITRSGIFSVEQDCYNAPEGCQATLLFDLSRLRQ